MVRLKKDSRSFPRRLSGGEQNRFWRKLQEDVWNCGEIMPNVSKFYRKFSDLWYDSFEDALENYRGFRDAICRGEEYEMPEGSHSITVYGKYEFPGSYHNIGLDNSTVYFTISTNSEQEIPEFPSWIILPLFVTATLAVIIYRKKLQKM